MYWLLLILLIPYLYLFLKIFRSLSLLKQNTFHSTCDLPVSVIVACRNEEENIGNLLHAISQQSYSPDLTEVIVIDDHSSDGTFSVSSGFKSIMNLKVLSNEGSGKKSAIRTGVRASGGSLILTTDADCIMGKQWIETVASFYLANKPDLILLPVEYTEGKSLFHRCLELEFLSLQGITAGTAISGNPVMCNGANLAFTKKAFIRNSENLHDEKQSGDDVFLLHGIKNERGKIMWLESDNALVITKPSGTLLEFLKQRARWFSKSGSYNDRFTLLLGFVTFVTIILELSLFAAGFFNPLYFLILALVVIIKSVPDYLILFNCTVRHNKKNLMRFFVPVQLVYPFYVISVVIYFLLTRKRYSL